MIKEAVRHIINNRWPLVLKRHASVPVGGVPVSGPFPYSTVDLLSDHVTIFYWTSTGVPYKFYSIYYSDPDLFAKLEDLIK